MIQFDETWMTGAGPRNRTPSTSRVEKTRAKAPRLAIQPKKGLPRSAVVVSRVKPDLFHVIVKGVTGPESLLGTIKRHRGPRRLEYSFKDRRTAYSRSGYPTQRAAVMALCEVN